MMGRLDLWRENRISQRFELTPEQIVQGGGGEDLPGSELGRDIATDPGFASWLETHEPRLNFDMALLQYLTAPDGRNSTFEGEQLQPMLGSIYDLARPAWVAYLQRSVPEGANR